VYRYTLPSRILIFPPIHTKDTNHHAELAFNTSDTDDEDYSFDPDITHQDEPRNLALIHISRIIRQEALEILFKESVFRYAIPNKLPVGSNLSTPPTQEVTDRIQNIEFDFVIPCPDSGDFNQPLHSETELYSSLNKQLRATLGRFRNNQRFRDGGFDKDAKPLRRKSLHFTISSQGTGSVARLAPSDCHGNRWVTEPSPSSCAGRAASTT